VLILLIGLIADLISTNRRLIEDSLFRLKKVELEVEKQKSRDEELLEEIRALRQALAPNLKTNSSVGLQVPSRIEEVEVEAINPIKKSRL
jgi:hypothetical protein